MFFIALKHSCNLYQLILLPTLQTSLFRVNMSDLNQKMEGDINFTPLRHKWMAALPASTRQVLDADAACFVHQSLSTPCMEVLEAAEGAYLITASGQRILDFHGNNLHQVGYRNPRVIEAVTRCMQQLPFSPRRYTNALAVELATRLTGKIPELSKVLFAPGGSEANSMALKLARIATGRFKVVSMWGAFHGAGLDTISVGGEASFRKGIGPLLTGVQHVPQPDSYRPMWENDAQQEHYVQYVRSVFEHEGDVGAFIAETVRNTDVQVPALNFWKKMRALCDEFGVVLILDEIPIALGRTGKFFAFEHYGIVPDMVTIGKGLGGALFPMAAVLVHKKYDQATSHSVGHFTHEKSSVGCAAGLAVLDELESRSLEARALELGNLMEKRLKEMKSRYKMIGDVRGLGLLWGIDLVTDRVSKTRATEAAEKVLYHCLERGLSFKVSQGSVINLCPPLIIDEHALCHALDILEDAFRRYLH